MKKLLIVTIMLMLGILASFGQGSVRPPVESTKVTAVNELDARKTIVWRNDSLVKSAFAYVEWDANCFRFRRITTGAAWSSWICAEEGESTSIAANAQEILELIGAAIAFKVQGKHSVLQSDENNNFRFKGNLVLNSKNTVLGSEAGISGYDSLFIGSDTLLVAKFDSTYVNTVLIGHNAKAVGDSTVVLGDETIKQVYTDGAFNGKGFLLEGDTVYLQHLINLNPADSGKIAMNNGSAVVWIPQKADSIQINGEWIELGGAFSFSDSIQINGVWVHLGGSVTTPDAQNLSWNPESGALGISGGTGVDLDGRYLTEETPQNLSWNGSTGALGIDGGTGVDLDGRYLVPPTATDGQIMVKSGVSWVAQTPTYFVPPTATTGQIMIKSGSNWVAGNLPETSADSIYIEAMGQWVQGGDTIASTCGCSGATGTFYSKEGKLITVDNGLVVNIGAPDPLGGIWIMKTNSTSSTYTPVNVTNGGSNLIWTVSGAVSTVYNGNEPTFDFSAAGEKIMTITSTDSLKGVSAVDVLALITYIEMQDMLLDTLLADQNEINTVKLINNNELVYADFDINSITSLTLTGLDELRVLRLNASGYFGALDLSTFANLEYIDAGDGNLSSITMPVSQDVLYYVNLNSGYWDSTDVNYVLNWCNFHGRTDHPDGGQLIMTGSGCGDLDKIELLDIAWYVEVDTCAVGPTGYIILKTSSESEEWEPSGVVNSGATLHWEVTGAATYSVDTDSPVFDFSAPGEKVITITSADNLGGISRLDISYIEISDFEGAGLSAVEFLDISNNALSGLDLRNTGLATDSLYIYGNVINQLNFNCSNFANVVDFGGDGNSLISQTIDSLLTCVISANQTGGVFGAYSQTGGGCGDLAKIAALDAIWEEVQVDTCAVESWTYEGVMTVGITPSEDLTGFILDEIGSLNPAFAEFYQILWDNTFSVFAAMPDVSLVSFDKISIDGIEYVPIFVDAGKNSYWTINVASNPFPPVGQTCEIKLRYTLAP